MTYSPIIASTLSLDRNYLFSFCTFSIWVIQYWSKQVTNTDGEKCFTLALFCWQKRSQVLYWVCLSGITTVSSHQHFSFWQQFHDLSKVPARWNGGRLKNKNLSKAQYDGWYVPCCYSSARQMKKRGVIDGRAKLFSYCFQYIIRN